MGIEGQNSPRDVASENKKHPWEIFPEDESSTGDSEKKREQKKKKKESREKRKMQLDKTKKWINTHHILILSIIIAVAILISGGIIAINKNKEKEIEDERDEIEEGYVPIEAYYPENYRVQDAYSAEGAYSYAISVVRDVALEGIENPYSGDTAKIEDNMDLYIEDLETDYEKLYYRIFTALMVSAYGNPERAYLLLSEIDAEEHEFDLKQRLMYYKAYEEYYFRIGDNENFKEWHDKINDDPEIEADSYIFLDRLTGEVVVPSEDYINQMKEEKRKEQEKQEEGRKR